MEKKEVILKKVGEIVNNNRRSKKLTQDDLAKLADTSIMTVQRLEVAAGRTRIDNFLSIILSLDLKLSEVFREAERLLGEKDYDPTLNSWEFAKSKIDNLSEQEKEWIGQIILKTIDRPRPFVQNEEVRPSQALS